MDCMGVKSWGIEHDCKYCIWLRFVSECYSGPVRAAGESSEQPVRRPEVCPAPLLHTGRQPTSHFQSPSFSIQTAVKMPDLRMPVCLCTLLRMPVCLCTLLRMPVCLCTLCMSERQPWLLLSTVSCCLHIAWVALYFFTKLSNARASSRKW